MSNSRRERVEFHVLNEGALFMIASKELCHPSATLDDLLKELALHKQISGTSYKDRKIPLRIVASDEYPVCLIIFFCLVLTLD